MSDQTSSLFDDVLRLVPNTGVQFAGCALDFEIATSINSEFLEFQLEHSGRNDTVLVPVNDLRQAPGIAAQNGTRRSHSVSGIDALKAFAGHWVPLPYFRFTGQSAAFGIDFDRGPSNWVRCFVSADAAMPDAKSTQNQCILAFDTGVDPLSRLDLPDYDAPCADDAIFHSRFALASGTDAVGWFLSEAWLIDWVTKVVAGRRSNDGGRSTSSGDEELSAFAHYLVLLEVLSTATRLPQACFADTLDRRIAEPVHDVDLILDIGVETTAALLVPRRMAAKGTPGAVPEHVRIRDLTNPTDVYARPFPSRIEFAEYPFGGWAATRLSSRTNAFNWPVATRVGFEARNLAQRTSAAEGVTGTGNVTNYLGADGPALSSWRYSARHDHTADVGDMVALPWVSNEQDASQVTLDEASTSATARSQFSRNALIGLYAAEIVLHALSHINDPRRHNKFGLGPGLYQLRSVKVVQELAQDAGERTLLITEVSNGIDRLWRDMGWQRNDQRGVLAKPNILPVIGGVLSAQTAVLKEEFEDRFGGDTDSFLNVPSTATVTGELRQSITIATVNISEQWIDVAIVDYEKGSASALVPRDVTLERLQSDGVRLVRTLATDQIVPAIERALGRIGLRRTQDYFSDSFGHGSTLFRSDQPHFRTRLTHKVLLPAARGIVRLIEDGADGFWHDTFGVPLRSLIAIDGGDIGPFVQYFSRLTAAQDGASFDIGDVIVPLHRETISQVIASTSAGSLLRLARVLNRREPSIIYAFGSHAEVVRRDNLLARRLSTRADKLHFARARPYTSVADMFGGDRDVATLHGLTNAFAIDVDQTLQIDAVGSDHLSLRALNGAKATTRFGLPILGDGNSVDGMTDSNNWPISRSVVASIAEASNA